MWASAAFLAGAIVVAGGLCSARAAAGGVDVAVPTNPSFATAWSVDAFDHDLWDAALEDHVDAAGLVNYEALCRDPRFLESLHRLANTPPEKLRDADARTAFWINAYNALAVQGVCHALPGDPKERAAFSVIEYRLPGVEGKAFFTGLRFQVGGRRYTLDQVEKGMLYQKPEIIAADADHYTAAGVARPDTRVHFAIVCGARGCPPLSRAYRATTVDRQLEEATAAFIRGPAVRLDAAGKVATVSQIFEWYAGDFTNRNYERSAQTVIAYLAEFVGTGRLGDSLRRDKWTLRYSTYDWALNAQPQAASESEKPPG